MKRKVKLSQTQQTILTALANAPSYSLGMLQLLDHLGYVFPIVLLPRVEHGIMSLYRQGCLQFSWHINAENVPLNCLEVDALSLTTLVRWNEHKQEWTLQLPDPAVIDLMIDLNLGSAEALHIFQQEHMTTTLHRRNATPTYQAALDYLYSFINYENKMPPSPDHARFNLDRMHWLLGELGDPHGHYPSVVVAGTKGKGSTSAMLESILRAAGYRTGLFSSPHLHSWRERIQVDRTLITQDQVAAYVEQIKPLVERLGNLEQPTVFELTTAIALRFFADQGIDVAVLEVGLGGRYDTVNVVTPRVSVITPISYDHMNVLGRTLAKIAYAKAGIIKPGVPVISAPQHEEALKVIVAEAEAQGAPLWVADDQHLAIQRVSGTQPSALNVQPSDVALGGAHQLINARVAIAAALLLREQGIDLPDAAVVEGLRTVRWPGRFEIVARDPLIVVDGAMNGDSAHALREALETLRHNRRILVLGTSSDKNVAAIARELVGGCAAVVLTRSYHPRSADVETLAAQVEPLLDPATELVITDDIPPALDAARRLAEGDDLICVAGSLFVVAAAREALGVAEEID